MKGQLIEEDLILVDLETLMRITGYGRRRAQSLGEMAKARVYIGNSVRFSVKKINEFISKEAF